MTALIETYRLGIAHLLERIAADGALVRAADAVATALAADRIIHVAGSGHSHMLAEEVFYRAGGIAAAQPILRADLMLHEGARASSAAERRPGVAEEVLAGYHLGPGDVLFITSNSGRNAFPVELALGARARGATSIAITSLATARAVTSRHPSGKLLADLADIVIDNQVPLGDATLPIPGHSQAMGPVSTIAGTFILNAVLAEAVAQLAARGIKVDIYQSANGLGDPAAATAIADRWQGRIRGL